MKNLVFYLVMCAVVLSATMVTVPSCRSGATITGEAVEAAGKIILTSNKHGDVLIHIAGSGSLTIDWGNGQEVETHTLSVYEDNFTSFHRYRQHYGNSSPRTVTITGENITHFNSVGNELISLDVSNNAALIELWCNEKQLTTLDVGNNRALQSLWVVGCSLTNLDVSNNKGLITLSCNGNQLRSLDVSNNSELKVLSCSGNHLRSLDLSNNTALTTIDCSHNQLTAAALDALFETLHDNTISGGKTIFTRHNPGISGCDKSIATRKEWLVIDN